MGDLGKAIITIATALIGVAIIATLVSKKANTAGVINSLGGAFTGTLNAALSPIK